VSFDFDAARIRQLLDELEQSLRAAEIAATVYLVGGAATSLHLPDVDRRTQDIKGITTDDQVTAVVAQLADELDFPEEWPSDAARPFRPPIPLRPSLDPAPQGCGFSWRHSSSCSQ